MDLDLEESSDCLFDFVELFDDVHFNNNSFLKLCGDILPQNQFKTPGRYLGIKFVSDRSMNKGGFKLVATATLGL